MIMSRTFSADESYFKAMDQKAEKAGVTPSAFFRALIELSMDYDFVREPDSLGPVWVKREVGHG